MTSKRAHYLDNGEIKFKGQVDIKSNTGAVYKMQAKELLINTPDFCTIFTVLSNFTRFLFISMPCA
jgi:hypothetical protein